MLVTIGLKSILSCFVGALIILMVHIICFSTSAPIDNFAYFLLFSILFFRYNTVKDELSFLNPVESIYSCKDMLGTANHNEGRNYLLKQ
jgi:hypothetical protein